MPYYIGLIRIDWHVAETPDCSISKIVQAGITAAKAEVEKG